MDSDDGDFLLRSLGHEQHVSGSMLAGRNRAFDAAIEAHQRNRAHLWIMTVAYRVDPERVYAGEALMDVENIATAGLGCYVCEEPYSKRIAQRSCPGEPS